MIYPNPRLRNDIMCIGGTSQWPATLFRGIDQWGEQYGYLLIDPIGGAIGAFASGDGINTGGQSRTPICQLPNVEHTEQNFPILFLYRKELTDSGGAGKFRGGLSAESCFIPNNTTSITQDTLSSGNAIPTSSGLMGGLPSTTNAYKFVKNSDILQRLISGKMPEDIMDLEGDSIELELRQQNFEQNPSDVYSVRWSGGGGFGDPFERNFDKIQEDLDNFAVSQSAARDIYGVIMGGDGKIDAEKTVDNRRNIRNKRRDKNRKPTRTGEVLHDVSEFLQLRSDKKGSFWACRKCSLDLGESNQNYKVKCVQEKKEFQEINPLIGKPDTHIDDTVEFRSFYCPGCGILFDNEIALSDEPLLWDTKPHLST